jgi:hypothetical protein
MEQAS